MKIMAIVDRHGLPLWRTAPLCKQRRCGDDVLSFCDELGTMSVEPALCSGSCDRKATLLEYLIATFGPWFRDSAVV